MPIVDHERFYERDAPADVPAEEGWEAWRIAALSTADFVGLGSESRLAYLAAFGLLAPSSHNTVPERFELRPADDQLGIWLDRHAILPDSDPTGRQATIGVGCTIANVELAARAVGLDTRVEVHDVPLTALRPFDDEGEPEVRLATLQFSSAGTLASSTDWRPLIRRRKMVRAEYDRSVPLPAELAEEIGAAVAAFAGLELHLLTDATTKLFLGKFQELADSTVINREGFARELSAWLLDNESRSPLGMRGREFGLSNDASRRFHRGLRGELRLLPDETAGFAKAGNIGMRSASAVGVITVAKDDLVHRLAAGRAYQRVALMLLRQDFVVAMHAGITEVMAPNMALRGRLKTRQRPDVVFRMGRPLDPKDGARSHASRPPLESILFAQRKG